MEKVESLGRVERVEGLERVERVEGLEGAERVESLERVESVEGLERVEGRPVVIAVRSNEVQACVAVPPQCAQPCVTVRNRAQLCKKTFLTGEPLTLQSLRLLTLDDMADMNILPGHHRLLVDVLKDL